MRGGHSDRRRGWARGLSARRLAAGLISLAAGAAYLAATAPAQAGPAMIRIGSRTPVPTGSVRLGALPGSTRLRVDVALLPRNPAALSQYTTAVSTPGSSLYHHYLTRAQFAARFGASSAAIAAVTSALRGLGLHPGAVSPNRLSIPVATTASAAERAFGTTLIRYRMPGGRLGFGTSRAPVLPAAAAAHVQAVVGLDNLAQMRPLNTRPSSAPSRRTRGTRLEHSAGEPTGGPQPCTAASDTASLEGSFTADEFAYAYEFSDLYGAGDFGQGVNVAIVEFGEPNLSSDISAYQSCYGTHTKVTYYSVDKYHQTGPGEGEAALDIETIIGLAPDASISVFRGPNTGTGTYDVYGAIVSQDKARVISVSYGLCEHYQSTSLASAVNTLFEEAAVQGQTVSVSSGDSGSEGCYDNDHNKNRYSVNFPASDPFVLSVGGTAIFDLVQRPGEVVWNEGLNSGDGAGGGGKSTFFAKPAYQSLLNISGSVREVPDVSADADPTTGYVVRYKGSWTSIGGTSAAAPLWASLMALTDEKCGASPVGWVNPVLYYVASPADSTIVANDIVTNSSFPEYINNDYTHQTSPSGKYPVKSGYDMATGIGSPVGGALAGELCKFNAEPDGYRLVTAQGQVYSFNAVGHGSVSHPASEVVGIAGDNATGGYWVVTAKGRVYAFDAPSHGSVSGHLASPVVGIAADSSGGGYWVVTAAGHVYAFGAPNHGSLAHLTSPVVGITGDPFTTGYWIATANGKVFSLAATNYSVPKIKAPATAIVADPAKQGYWLINASGRVYAIHVGNDGSMPVGSQLGRVIGIAADPSGGYWLTTAAGYVGAFATFWHGDRAGQSPKNPVTGIAATP